MSKLIVVGGQKLKGEVTVEGAKNAVLPILAATVLNEGLNVIRNCPDLKDVEITLKILDNIGCKVSKENDVVMIDSSTINSTFIPEDLASEMRSSIIFMGPILAKYGKVTISYPGDCITLWAHCYNNSDFYSAMIAILLLDDEPYPFVNLK
jgi:UDP-N-acetylglucosamine 1-carboxyvinyltransferase